jgi:DNA-binding GntR family transcriptional regulator
MSRVDNVTNYLLKCIFSGVYPPGSALPETKLAKEVGVSQATVREALQRLEHAGLVTRIQNVGTAVTRLTPRDIEERVSLRADLEARASLEAAQRIGPDEIMELKRLLEVLGSFVRTDAYYEAAQADLDFHRYVWRCSGNQMLCCVLEQITVPLIAFVSILRSTGLEHLQDVVQSHEPLLEALISKDPDKIVAAFKSGAEASYSDFIASRSRRAVALGLMSTNRRTEGEANRA